MKNKQLFRLRIISAQNLPTPSHVDIVKDIIDPYVIVNIYGVPDDHNEWRTKAIQDNGFNPRWDEEFEFTINCPELAFVKFTVKDHDISSQDDLIGEYCVRYSNIRKGN